MARSRSTKASLGFSLVELMVALVFTMVLMAGMSAVFKASLTTFATTGEKLASLRRNRMALDMVYDDLNNAGMYLTDLSNPPAVSSGNEAFYFLPDPTKIPGVTQGADELYFYMDEPLPFEGTLRATQARTASSLVATGAAIDPAKDFTYDIECDQQATNAKLVKKGQVIIFKDFWELGYINNDPSPTGSRVTVTVGADPNAAINGSGLSGLPNKFQHIVQSGAVNGTGIVFIRPRQMVRYSIQTLNLDPASKLASTLCLVRDQGTYSTSGFTPDPVATPQQIITENVVGFRVYLSADSGRNWVGGPDYTSWAAPSKGVKAALEAQLQNFGRNGYTSIGTNLNWFRSIPVLVRVDVTTRTAVKRSEYSQAGDTLEYKQQVKSVVMVPRHFGLALN